MNIAYVQVVACRHFREKCKIKTPEKVRSVAGTINYVR